jgi:hypothetical protein
MVGCDAGILAELWLDMARQDYRQTLREATLPLFCLYGERSRLYRPALAAAMAATAAACCRPGWGPARLSGWAANVACTRLAIFIG